MKALRQSDPTTVERFASKIFFRKPADHMTSRQPLATICSGLWVSCHLKPTQRKLFYGLYARAGGRVMANRASGGGLFIATGPAETGKSVATQLFLACQTVCRMLATGVLKELLRPKTAETQTQI